MAFPRRQAAIVGTYLTEQGRSLDRTSFSLELEAIKGALADAGLTPDDVDGVVPMGASSEAPHRPEMFWATQFGGRPLTYGEIGYPNGVTKAALAISAGLADVVVVFWGKAGWKIGPGSKPVPASAPRTYDWAFDVHGAYMTAWYAFWAQRYMHEFGITSEDLAEVAVAHRHHAVIGGAEATHIDGYTTVDPPWFPEQGHSVRRSGDIAFAQAGVTRDDIDVAGLYDCFTITMIRDLEELGFCGIGEGVPYFKEGHTFLGGDMPANTDGGLLSNTHCGLPHGLHTIEVARQLRGECGARQVPGARIGLSLAQGAPVHGYAGTMIMAVD